MYLMQPNSLRINNRKWNLGRMRGLGLRPVRFPNLGRLGQASTDIDFATGLPCDDPRANCGVWNTPSTPPGAQNPSPVAGGASNGGITTVLATTPSQSPLDYTSPQAAIAAGLDPQTVYNAWTTALARFSSPQAAITAGVPAGVVNQLWQQAHVQAANQPAKFLDQSPLGIKNSTLLMAGGGIFLLAMLRGGRGRR